MMGLLSTGRAASMDGGEIWRAAEKAGLSTDVQTLNKIVALINSGMSADDAAQSVKGSAAGPSGGGK